MWKFLPGLLTAICWGISYALIEKMMINVDKKIFLLTYSFFSFLVYLSYNLYTGISLPKLDVCNLNYFILAVITMMLGTFLSMKAIESSSATSAAILELTYPIWCILVLMIFFGHNYLNYKAIFGMALVFIGTFIFLINEK